MAQKTGKFVSGFSKLSKREKLSWLARHFFNANPLDAVREFGSFWHSNIESQKLFDGISENVITNFYLPYCVAPNFLINGKAYCVPMVIEESSVVAAASSGAKFWHSKGGFQTEVISTTKVGHVHFCWQGEPFNLFAFFDQLKAIMLEGVKHITTNMERRGGGVKNVEILHLPEIEQDYYQIKVEFETCDAMGANFINSVLEAFAEILIKEIRENVDFADEQKEVQVIMSILSNYTPSCVVRSQVSHPISELGKLKGGMEPEAFAEKFVRAVKIARNDVYRATTHNKGIFNGIDAVIIATGNDFRAIEACGHAYACRNGKYQSLSNAYIENGLLFFELEVPLAIGTVGGLTTIHPLAKRSLELLGNPSARELMGVIASVGLAQNFAAVKSLVTTGIQFGHMKMHLSNILLQLEADQSEMDKAFAYFQDKTISFTAVRVFLSKLRDGEGQFAY